MSSCFLRQGLWHMLDAHGVLCRAPHYAVHSATTQCSIITGCTCRWRRRGALLFIWPTECSFVRGFGDRIIFLPRRRVSKASHPPHRLQTSAASWHNTRYLLRPYFTKDFTNIHVLDFFFCTTRSMFLWRSDSEFCFVSQMSRRNGRNILLNVLHQYFTFLLASQLVEYSFVGSAPAGGLSGPLGGQNHRLPTSMDFLAEVSFHLKL